MLEIVHYFTPLKSFRAEVLNLFTKTTGRMENLFVFSYCSTVLNIYSRQEAKFSCWTLNNVLNYINISNDYFSSLNCIILFHSNEKLKSAVPKEDLKLVIFILFEFLQVVNVGRSVIIFHVLPMYAVRVTLAAWLPVVWSAIELLRNPYYDVFYF